MTGPRPTIEAVEKLQAQLEEVLHDLHAQGRSDGSAAIATRYPTLVDVGDQIYEVTVDIKLSAKPAKVQP
jgi:hypothetical protein